MWFKSHLHIAINNKNAQYVFQNLIIFTSMEVLVVVLKNGQNLDTIRSNTLFLYNNI